MARWCSRRRRGCKASCSTSGKRPIPGPVIDGRAFFGDVGLPGPDGGKGGKFLILPPGYDKPVPDGAFVYRSGTNSVFVFLRSFYKDSHNLTPAVALMEQAKIYPLGGQATAKPMQYPDASGVPVNMLPASDGKAFEQLKHRHWLNPIADGTPANPGGPFDLAWNRINGNYLDLDARIWFFTDYYSISPGMISQTPGKGAKYMIAFTDSAGVPLSGASSYRVQLPPNIPAANFWSLTLYDAENASGLANGQPFPSLGSRDKPAADADGSTTLYLGPEAAPGKSGNWLRTVPGKGYFAILRLYGPTEAAIDKSWKPGDIDKVN